MRSTIKASEYFGLFLTELRRAGYQVPLSDKAAAELLKDGVDLLEPDEDDPYITAESLSAALEHVAELAVTDNGSDGTSDDGGAGMSARRIIVIVRGGNVEAVMADGDAPLRVEVLDYDNVEALEQAGELSEFHREELEDYRSMEAAIGSMVEMY